MWLNNGWYFILENITCGYGNHSWNIEFITRGLSATRDKFNISLVITITTRDIFQYQIPAIVYSPSIHNTRIFQVNRFKTLRTHLFPISYQKNLIIYELRINLLSNNFFTSDSSSLGRFSRDIIISERKWLWFYWTERGDVVVWIAPAVPKLGCYVLYCHGGLIICREEGERLEFICTVGTYDFQMVQ